MMLQMWFVAMLLFSPSDMPDVPLQRDVILDPTSTYHPVTVIGGYGVGTNVQLPDSFEKHNVICGGQCAIVEPGDAAAAAANPDDQRNWVMEIKPNARILSLRPRNLPDTIENPSDSFMTNILVKLDGGHTVNITVRLLSLRDHESAPDGLVILRLPESESLDGKLKSKVEELERTYDQRIRVEVNKQLAKSLGEGVRCQKTGHFAKNHRDHGVSLFVREVCRTQGSGKFFWAVFDVKNRSGASVHLASARLEAAQDDEKVNAVTDHYFFKEDPIYFDEETRGVATAAIVPQAGIDNAPVPHQWELSVETKTGTILRAENLVF